MTLILLLVNGHGTDRILHEVLPEGWAIDNTEVEGSRYELCVAEVASPQDVEGVEELRRRHPRMKIIAVLPPERAQEAAALTRLKAAAVLALPVSTEALGAAVRDVFKHMAPSGQRLADEIEDVLATCYSDAGMDEAALAVRLRVNVRTVQRAMREHGGTTFRQRLEGHRVKAARKLLMRTDEPLKRIADWCGFRGEAQLRAAIRRATGLTPSQLRQPGNVEKGRGDTNMLSLLIADDDRDARCTMVRWVKRLEPRLEVVEAEDGAQALTSLRNRKVDVALLDLLMPEATGLQVLQQARHEQIDTPVVLLTGFGTVDMATAAIEAGAADVLTKPPHFRQVVERLANLAGLNRPVVSPRARQVLAFIETHACSPDMSPTTIAEHFGLSKGYVQELVNAAQGMSLMAHLHRLRMARARELLAKTEIPVGDVGRATGYGVESTFRRVFEKEAGESPRAYRRRHPLILQATKR